MNETPEIVRLAEDAEHALRALARLTNRGVMPAPDLYDVLGALKQILPPLEHALVHLPDRLLESLEVYDVYEDHGGNPFATANRCVTHLETAMLLIAQLGHTVDNAQAAISGQSYRVEPRQRQRPEPSTDTPAGSAFPGMSR